MTARSPGLPTMIGVALLSGLVTRNSLLLADFRNELRHHGKGSVEALLEAGPTRLRPIPMTAAAPILGVQPLALITGFGRRDPHADGGGGDRRADGPVHGARSAVGRLAAPRPAGGSIAAPRCGLPATMARP